MCKKIKVLHLLQSNMFSGAENVVCQIIDLFKNDDKMEMVYSSQDGQIRDALKDRNIKFYPMKKLCIKEAKRVIKEYKPDIIHAHDTSASVIASIVGGKVKVISHMHSNNESMRKCNYKSLLYLLCTSRYKHIYWVSNSSYNNYRFKKQLAKKSSILFNVVDRESILNKKNADNNKYNYDIVYIGRLTYPKNPERLMRVLKLVINKESNTKVAVVGTGNLLDSTKQLAFELGIDNNITFLGFQDNPLKIMYDAKVMSMTSRYEGTPMCALEAMALGLPIVSTPTDGLVDLVVNDVTGYLSNDDNEMAEKLCSVLKNDGLQLRLSEGTLSRFNSINDLDYYKKTLMKVYYE